MRSGRGKRRIEDVNEDGLDVFEEEEEEEEINVSQKVLFSQVDVNELTQSIADPHRTEESRFESLNSNTREKAIMNLSRLMLFKCVSGQHNLDRLKCIEEALKADGEALSLCKQVGNALFKCACSRLKNVFGFEVVPVPDFMLDELSTKRKDGTIELSSKYKNRFYVLNKVPDDNEGSQSRALHENEASSEKGLLMVILAFAYCKGVASSFSSTKYSARWITEEQLYNLLHTVDPSIPEDPPITPRKRSSDYMDVDSSLKKFVELDYLLLQKVEHDGETIKKYSMGPRSALEIGRRQLIHFCAEILGETVDETMLNETQNT